MTARGVRNRNPGNIVLSSWTKSQPGYAGPEDGAGRFATFETFVDGIAALMRLLEVYRKTYGLTTVRGILNRWAPPVENETTAYVAAVASALGVDADAELPDTPETYVALARAIARHENGGDASEIPPDDYAQAAALVFGPAEAPTTPEAETVTQPEKKMGPAVPFIIKAAADVLIPIVADLFRGHGGTTATRNAEIVERAGPAIVEIAKAATGSPVEQVAVQKILDDPGAREAFRRAVAADLDRLVGLIERTTRIDDESRDRAAARAAKEGKDFGPLLITRQFWMLAALASATVVAFVVALYLKASNEILVGLMVLFTGLVNSTSSKWSTMIEYRFGSSSGSAAKDEIIAAARAPK